MERVLLVGPIAPATYRGTPGDKKVNKCSTIFLVSHFRYTNALDDQKNVDVLTLLLFVHNAVILRRSGNNN